MKQVILNLQQETELSEVLKVLKIIFRDYNFTYILVRGNITIAENTEAHVAF